MVVFVDYDSTDALNKHQLPGRAYVERGNPLFSKLMDMSSGPLSHLAEASDGTDTPEDQLQATSPPEQTTNQNAFSAALNCYPYARYGLSTRDVLSTDMLQDCKGDRPLSRPEHPPRPSWNMPPVPYQHHPIPASTCQGDPALRKRVHRNVIADVTRLHRHPQQCQICPRAPARGGGHWQIDAGKCRDVCARHGWRVSTMLEDCVQGNYTPFLSRMHVAKTGRTARSKRPPRPS